MSILRPKSLSDIVGNENLKECIKINIMAALNENRALSHVIFQGHYGCGKTTFARAMAHEMKCNLIEINAASIKKNKDILEIFSRVKEKDVLFIDEIHRLKAKHEELLYPLMEDFETFVPYSDGTKNHVMSFKVPKFTMIGATTDLGALSGPLFSRFQFNYYVELYSIENIKKIILHNSKLLGVGLDDDAANEIAKRSKNIPRIANARLEWIRDYSIYRTKPYINKEDVVEAMKLIDIDDNGYDKNDRLYLSTLEKMQPAGIASLAAATSMTPETISKYIEPYLLNQGIIHISKEGRCLTEFKEFNDRLMNDELTDEDINFF